MRYAVQVDPDVLAAGARGLATTAQTLDALAGRVLALCGDAGMSAGPGELSAALDGTGRAAARAIGQAASAVDVLSTRTGRAGEDYRLLEQALTSRLALTGGPPTDAVARTRGAEAPA